MNKPQHLGFRLRSLRVRIILFAALVCLILLVLIGVVMGVLRNTQSAGLRTAERHLHTVALSVQQAYNANPKYSQPLAQLERFDPHPPAKLESGSNDPVPPPGPPPPPPPPPHHPPMETSSLLEQLMSNALMSEPGVEGGFFSVGNGALGGYSFPTHEAPGPPKEMPVRERPTIEGLARSAATSGTEKSFRFQGQHDAVLFDAIPLRASSATDSPVIGAAWLMERLPGAEAEEHRQLLWGAFGFASMALVICAAAFVILSEVRTGLQSVSNRLVAVASGADVPNEFKTTTLEEFDNVLFGIDQMAHELQGKIEKERTFEAQMAHRERLAAVGQFAAGIAHELRTPLATIRLRTQMSQNAQEHEMAATNIRVVLAEIDRLNTMIGKLLHFARPVQMHETLLDLCAVARDRVQRLNEEYGADAAKFHEPAEPVIVSGDSEEFRQVFDNLLENALQASAAYAATPHAEVTLVSSGANAVVHVLDRGPGFDKESLRKALSPFYTTKERGTGLGLSIVNEILRARGGTLVIENRENGGADVWFEITAYFPTVPSGEENHA